MEMHGSISPRSSWLSAELWPGGELISLATAPRTAVPEAAQPGHRVLILQPVPSGMRVSSALGVLKAPVPRFAADNGRGRNRSPVRSLDAAALLIDQPGGPLSHDGLLSLNGVLRWKGSENSPEEPRFLTTSDRHAMSSARIGTHALTCTCAACAALLGVEVESGLDTAVGSSIVASRTSSFPATPEDDSLNFLREHAEDMLFNDEDIIVTPPAGTLGNPAALVPFVAAPTSTTFNNPYITDANISTFTNISNNANNIIPEPFALAEDADAAFGLQLAEALDALDGEDVEEDPELLGLFPPAASPAPAALARGVVTSHNGLRVGPRFDKNGSNTTCPDCKKQNLSTTFKGKVSKDRHAVWLGWHMRPGRRDAAKNKGGPCKYAEAYRNALRDSYSGYR